MKTALKLFVAVLFILAAVRVTEAQNCTISGKVRYADNNEIVTSGVVKLFNSQGNVVSAVNINEQGDWIIVAVKGLLGDLIGFPNIEPEEDYVPTGYPDKTDPAMFTHIDIQDNIPGLDIYVQRSSVNMRPGVTSNINGIVLSNNVPVSDAVVYVKQGDVYAGFGVTNSKGEYKINNIN